MLPKEEATRIGDGAGAGGGGGGEEREEGLDDHVFEDDDTRDFYQVTQTTRTGRPARSERPGQSHSGRATRKKRLG